MMISTDVKPRMGLNTSTGQRNQPRMAGGMPVKQINSFELPTGTLQERLDALIAKQKDAEKLEALTKRNRDGIGAGENPTLDTTGTFNAADATTKRLQDGLAKDGSILGQNYGSRLQMDNNAAADAKARQLGQYNRVEGTAGAYRTDSGNAFSGQFWQQAAIADQAQAASLEAQRNNNRISAKTVADAAGQADNAYSQRYAAAQAADAQKFASTMQMFGQIAQPGNYKYWGG